MMGNGVGTSHWAQGLEANDQGLRRGANVRHREITQSYANPGGGDGGASSAGIESQERVPLQQ